MLDPAAISRDGEDWTSACRRYVFINHHGLRQTIADSSAGLTAASRERAFFANATNCHIDLQSAVIADVEATTFIRQEAWHSPLDGESGTCPAFWRFKIEVGVREKFGLKANLC